MTNPTDPRIEAATRAWIRQVDRISLEKTGKVAMWDDAEILSNIRTGMEYALKAADEAAWLPIESAPGNTCVIVSHPDYVFPAFKDELFSEEHNLGLFFSNSGGLPCGPLDPQPTHWQPLPTPPETR